MCGRILISLMESSLAIATELFVVLKGCIGMIRNHTPITLIWPLTIPTISMFPQILSVIASRTQIELSYP